MVGQVQNQGEACGGVRVGVGKKTSLTFDFFGFVLRHFFRRAISLPHSFSNLPPQVSGKVLSALDHWVHSIAVSAAAVFRWMATSQARWAAAGGNAKKS